MSNNIFDVASDGLWYDRLSFMPDKTQALPLVSMLLNHFDSKTCLVQRPLQEPYVHAAMAVVFVAFTFKKYCGIVEFWSKKNTLES